MEYDLYKSCYKRKASRPFGMGAFFDYRLALMRHFASQSARLSAWRAKSLAPPQPQQGAEERWDAEGGNSQTRIARRAAHYER
jgi:hypothetical protein